LPSFTNLERPQQANLHRMHSANLVAVANVTASERTECGQPVVLDLENQHFAHILR
jgi:hypothetical protein